MSGYRIEMADLQYRHRPMFHIHDKTGIKSMAFNAVLH